jgi:hypothetical protein
VFQIFHFDLLLDFELANSFIPIVDATIANIGAAEAEIQRVM